MQESWRNRNYLVVVCISRTDFSRNLSHYVERFLSGFYQLFAELQLNCLYIIAFLRAMQDFFWKIFQNYALFGVLGVKTGFSMLIFAISPAYTSLKLPDRPYIYNGSCPVFAYIYYIYVFFGQKKHRQIAPRFWVLACWRCYIYNSVSNYL